LGVPQNRCKNIWKCAGGPNKVWFQNKHQEKCPFPKSKHFASRVHVEPQARTVGVTKDKTFDGSKGVEKVVEDESIVMQKDVCNIGGGEKFLSCPTPLKGLHRQHGGICTTTIKDRLGFKLSFSQGTKTSNFGCSQIVGNLAGQAILEKRRQGVALRQLNMGLGRFRPQEWEICQRFLGGESSVAQKCKGVGSSYINSNEFGQRKRNSFIVSRQHSDILLPNQGGEGTPFEPDHQTLPMVVYGTSSSSASSMGPLRGNDGRQLEQMGGGPWGLHPESKYFCLDDEGVQPLDNPHGRYVCLSRQHKVEKFCFKVATLPSHQGGCIKMPFGRFSSHICQPPMDHNTPMVTQIKTTPSF